MEETAEAKNHVEFDLCQMQAICLPAYPEWIF